MTHSEPDTFQFEPHSSTVAVSDPVKLQFCIKMDSDTFQFLRGFVIISPIMVTASIKGPNIFVEYHIAKQSSLPGLQGESG